MAEDSWKGPNQYISQAYVFGRPFGSLPIRIEAGKFFTSVGAGTGPERSGFQYIEIPNILVRQPALSCRNREQRAHHGKIHHRRAVVERLQYDRRRSRPSIDGLYGSLGGQTLQLVPTL